MEGNFKITLEEFLKAQAIVEEYHRERQQQADLELEDDDPTNWGYEDEDDIEERREMDRAGIALNCSCGAWVIGKDGRGYHVADCVCGAE